MLATNRLSIVRHAPRSSITGSRLVFVRSLTLGIRQEDPSRIWERRAPLTPDAVKSLVEEDGVEVLVQPCARRVYPISSYLAVSLSSIHITLLLTLQ
jgi:alpha-aminoadipic semialdehyde synthase